MYKDWGRVARDRIESEGTLEAKRGIVRREVGNQVQVHKEVKSA